KVLVWLRARVVYNPCAWPVSSSMGGSMNMRHIVAFASALVVLQLSQLALAAPYSFTKVASNSGTFISFSQPSINNIVTVAFEAFLDNGTIGVYTGNGGAPNTVIDSTGSFSSFGSMPTINSSGTVAFTAAFDNQTSDGIFTRG